MEMQEMQLTPTQEEVLTETMETPCEEQPAESEATEMTAMRTELEALREELSELRKVVAEQEEQARRRRINEENAKRSTGAIENVSDSGYYSPEEVKKMSAAEVRKHYGMIIESMKKWN